MLRTQPGDASFYRGQDRQFPQNHQLSTQPYNCQPGSIESEQEPFGYHGSFVNGSSEQQHYGIHHSECQYHVGDTTQIDQYRPSCFDQGYRPTSYLQSPAQSTSEQMPGPPSGYLHQRMPELVQLPQGQFPIHYHHLPTSSAIHSAGLTQPGFISPFRRSGTKKALLIAINYSGEYELQGPINDIKFIHYFLTTKCGYDPSNITVLTDRPFDKPCGHISLPTRANILQYLGELVHYAMSGDSLFFHFSGHGVQINDQPPYDEIDGLDEALVPLDFHAAPYIVDDELYQILAMRIPRGVRLTCVIDCCHCGTVLDLPYNYIQRNEHMTPVTVLPGHHSNSDAAASTPILAANNGAFALVPQPSFQEYSWKFRRHHGQCSPGSETGVVLLFSGSADPEKAADHSGRSYIRSGAMTYAFLYAVEQKLQANRPFTYAELLDSIRDKMCHQFSIQTPQFSSSHHIDLLSLFSV